MAGFARHALGKVLETSALIRRALAARSVFRSPFSGAPTAPLRVFVERGRHKKEPPEGGSFWGWGRTHCAGVYSGRLTFTPSVKSSPCSAESASGNVTVPPSPTVAPVTVVSSPFTVRV